MKNHPKTIKAIAIVNKEEFKFNPMDLYSIKDEDTFILNNDECKCLVEIKFIKWLK